MSEYILYIDESETFDKQNHRYFVMSGVIINKKDYAAVENGLNQLKQNLWSNVNGCEQYILHEKDVSYASNRLNSRQLGKVPQYFHIFTNQAKVNSLYQGLSKLFKDSDIVTMGVCLDKNKLYQNYGEQFLNDQFTIAIQLLIEHYCHFLISHHAVGEICYEAMQPEQNAKIQQRIYELKALGTMYYTPKTIQNTLLGISFVAKQQNLAGLQLADFVPNTLARYAAGMKAKHNDFSKNIRKKLYNRDKNVELSKFGFKILG